MKAMAMRLPWAVRLLAVAAVLMLASYGVYRLEARDIGVKFLDRGRSIPGLARPGCDYEQCRVCRKHRHGDQDHQHQLEHRDHRRGYGRGGR